MKKSEVYFSVDVETDGPIPGPFSMLSFSLVLAGRRLDGKKFERPRSQNIAIYTELQPISDTYDPETLAVSGLDREKLVTMGTPPLVAMRNAYQWVQQILEVTGTSTGLPVLVGYPIVFDWMWLYWYFIKFCPEGSPFGHSRAFDIKTAYAVKADVLVSAASRSKIAPELQATRPHTHHALSDAGEQAEIFANVMEWKGTEGIV
jgi:hypothetical protein